MRSRAIYTLLFLGILTLAGCGSSARGTQAPALVFPTAATGPSGPPPLSAYVSASGQQGSSVYALNAATGGQRWQYQIKVATGYPYLDSGGVYFSAADGKVYALDAGSGSVKWSHALAGFPTVIGIANGVIYVGTTKYTVSGQNTQPGTVSALNESDGSVKWQSQVEGFVEDMDNDAIYLATPDEKLDALKLSDGSLKWSFQGDNPPFVQQIANGQVYVETNPNQASNNKSAFYALNASNGSVQWRYPSGTGDLVMAGMAVDSDTVYLEANPDTGLYVYTANTIFALSVKDGSQRWQTTLQGSALNTASLDSGTLYASSGGGHIYALNTQNGAVIWEAQTGNNYPAIEAIDSGLIYVSAFGDGLFVLNEKDGSTRWRYTSDAFVEVFSITNGIAYAATAVSQNSSEHSTVLGLNIADGSALWHHDAGLASVTIDVG